MRLLNLYHNNNNKWNAFGVLVRILCKYWPTDLSVYFMHLFSLFNNNFWVVFFYSLVIFFCWFYWCCWLLTFDCVPVHDDKFSARQLVGKWWKKKNIQCSYMRRTCVSIVKIDLFIRYNYVMQPFHCTNCNINQKWIEEKEKKNGVESAAHEYGNWFQCDFDRFEFLNHIFRSFQKLFNFQLPTQSENWALALAHTLDHRQHKLDNQLYFCDFIE